MLPISFFPILFGVLAFFATSAQAAAPSGEAWLTIKTPHFRVHHTAPLEAYARHFAFALERALPKLETSLHWKAPTPVDIVVMDPSDSANGLAMNFPNTHIEVFATPFEQDSPLGYYHDWVNELATHELTHIIANDSALGFYLTLRSIFGSWVKPNGLQPLWLIEGLAVYQETALGSAGRGRSPWLDALLRVGVRENKLTSPSYTSLDRFNDGNPWWPGGALPYLLGYTIQSLGTADRPNLPGDLSYQNSGLVPFRPNSNLEGLLGKDWAALWNGATQRLQERYGKEEANPAPACFLSAAGRQTGGHALSSDGWVYFSEENWERGVQFSRVRADAPCNGAEVERLYHKEYGGPGQVAVSEDGSLAAFSMFTHQRFEHLLSDIYLWHRDSGKTEQLTSEKRARDPAFSGAYLFYVYQKPDTSQVIQRLELATGDEKEIYAAAPLERLSGLHARGDWLAFSLHDNRGNERIYRLPTQGGRAELLNPYQNKSRTHERNPYLAADGSVYFASTADHEPNTQEIYRWHNKKAELVYSSSSGFVDRPIPLANGELLVQEYHLAGMDVARVKPGRNLKGPQSDLHQFLTGQAPVAEAPPTAAELAALGAAEPYSAVSTPATSLWPQYWLPEVAAAEEGWLIGASTSGNDPLEYHRYGIVAQYDSRARFPTYRAFYRNRQAPTNFLFEARQYNDYFISTNLSNRSAIYSAQAVIPIGETFYSFGGAFQEKSLFGRKGQSVILFQNLSYDWTGKTPAAVDPNFGEVFRAYVGLYPNAKNEKLFVDLRPTAGIYFGGFRPSHSVGITAKAGITTNKLLASNYYLGGGLSVLSSSDFVVRGYPVDTLLGQRIATLNASYTLPLAHPYRGWGTRPLFLENLGLRFLADAGTANFLSRYRGATFFAYQANKLGSQILPGFGADLVANGSLFYHVPLSVVGGLHYGPREEFGGGFTFFFGLNVGLNGNPVAAKPRQSD